MTLTYLQIISCVWLWVMLGLWVMQEWVEDGNNIRLFGLIPLMLFTPFIALIILLDGKDLNPIIWRKRK